MNRWPRRALFLALLALPGLTCLLGLSGASAQQFQAPQPMGPMLPPPSGGVVVGGGRLFTLRGNELFEWDPQTLKLLRTRRVPGGGPGGGIWSHRVLRATSADGVHWKRDPGVLIEHASVPDAVQLPDGTVRIYYCSAFDEENVTTALVSGSRIREVQPTNLHGVDPCALVTGTGITTWVKEGLESSRVVRFESRDGIRFSQRTVVWDDPRYPMATDPDVIRTPQGWQMYLSMGRQLLRCDSVDGKRFTSREVLNLGGSVCDTISVDGGYRMFFHGQPASGGPLCLWSARSKDGKNWRTDTEPVLAPSLNGPDFRGIGDAAPVRLKDGSYVLFCKSFSPE